MSEPTLDERVTRIEQLIERAIEHGRKSAFGRALLAKLGLT